MKHSVRHDLGIDQAKKVTRAALDSYSEKFAKYNPTVSWQSETRAKIGFTAKGVSLDGAIEVNSSSIDLELEVPFLLRPFRGKALSVIEGEIQEWIGKAKDGQI